MEPRTVALTRRERRAAGRRSVSAHVDPESVTVGSAALEQPARALDLQLPELPDLSSAFNDPLDIEIDALLQNPSSAAVGSGGTQHDAPSPDAQTPVSHFSTPASGISAPPSSMPSSVPLTPQMYGVPPVSHMEQVTNTPLTDCPTVPELPMHLHVSALAGTGRNSSSNVSNPIHLGSATGQVSVPQSISSGYVSQSAPFSAAIPASSRVAQSSPQVSVPQSITPALRNTAPGQVSTYQSNMAPVSLPMSSTVHMVNNPSTQNPVSSQVPPCSECLCRIISIPMTQ